ncbi:uncharacterized protein AstCC [Venturia canescens]|uniref:uncharacterized protein AstCC n=1 Tax=Venturia canescens TaxID=32260 RepID=UPI001C9C35CF|nr:uncharacterized protein LOC122408062 [Venturia canescens]
MATSFILFVLMATLTITGSVALVLPKRNLPDNVPDNYDYYDYPEKYNDYPVVVTKRAALLLDRLMVALQKAIDDQGGSESGGMDTSVGLPMRQQPHSIVNTGGTSISNDKSSIDRRAQGKGRVYWRCYFNAVTCFKK